MSTNPWGRPLKLLRDAGYSATELNAAVGKNQAKISRILNGREPWDDTISAALLKLTGNPALTGAIEYACYDVREAFLNAELEGLAQARAVAS